MSCAAMGNDKGECSIRNQDCTKIASIAFSFGPRDAEINANACQPCAVEFVNALAFITHSHGGDEIKLSFKKRKRAK